MISLKKLRNTFIIAEVSANHGQSFKRAVSLIQKAKESGADAVKFQAYTPDSLTLKCSKKYFKIHHPKWGGQTLYQLYEKAYTPWKWFKKLKKVADDLGIIFFATAFDKKGVDFLEELNVPMHKIASFELVDLPLIEYMAKTKKPLMLSTGLANLSEIREAIAVVKKTGARNITLLRCISNYPAKPENMNLRTLPDLRRRFKLPVGISDHSLGIGVSLSAVALGATVVEKHFKLSNRVKSVDSFFSITPNELRELVENIRIVEKSLGKVSYSLTRDDKKNRVFRRSLFVVKNIKKGELFTEDNIKSIRPGNGLKPKYLTRIIGRKAKSDLRAGEPLSWKVISG